MNIRLTFLSLFLFHAIAHGGLKWERQRVELAPGPHDTFVDAKFAFVNAGTEPVTIEKVEPSCGCTTATLSKNTFSPGENGELATRFDIGGRRGVQTKSVTVRIKGEKEPTILTLIVSIPDLVSITPGLVIWEKGEPKKPKTILLKTMPGLHVKILSVLSSDPRMKAKLETVKDGDQYSVTVTPDSTDVPAFAVLTIDSQINDQKKALRAYAQVKHTQQQ